MGLLFAATCGEAVRGGRAGYLKLVGSLTVYTACVVVFFRLVVLGIRRLNLGPL
jgi:hypothetical protein